jgi:hypothetical protein
MRPLLVILLCPALAAADPAAAQLEAGWRALHPGRALPPACGHADPVRQIVADLDEEPGRETALASKRLGVVLFAADGRALAGMELGCGRGEEPGQDVRELLAVRASGLGHADLVVRAREQGHCGRVSTWTLLGRRARELFSRLSVEEEADLQCGSSPRIQHTARIDVPAAGAVRVTVDEKTTTYRLRGDAFQPQQP